MKKALIPTICAMGLAGALLLNAAPAAAPVSTPTHEVHVAHEAYEPSGYWSLILLEPGIDPLSGERYDEYVLDFNMTMGDCYDRMASMVGEISCERQPDMPGGYIPVGNMVSPI